MKKIHYGWVICACCVIINFLMGGLTSIGFSVFSEALQDNFGFSNTQTSLIPAIRCFSSMITMPFVYKYYQKLSLRLGICIAGGILVAAYGVFFLAFSSFALYAAGAILMGVSYSLGSTVPISLLLHKWFQSSHSTAVGISFSGTGLCSILMPVLAERMLRYLSIHIIFAIVAAAVGGLVLLTCILVKNQPEDIGLQPYIKENDKTKINISTKKTNEYAMNKIQFICFLIAAFMIGCVGSPTSTHLAIHYATAGFTPYIAATGISLFGMALTFGKLVQGYLEDRFGVFQMNFLFLGFFVAGEFLTSAVHGGETGMLYLSGIMVGLGISTGTVGLISWISDLSTEEQYAKNLTISQSVFSVGALATSSVPGIIADYTGSYQPAFMLFGCMTALIFIIIQSLYLKRFSWLRRQEE